MWSAAALYGDGGPMNWRTRWPMTGIPVLVIFQKKTVVKNEFG